MGGTASVLSPVLGISSTAPLPMSGLKQSVIVIETSVGR